MHILYLVYVQYSYLAFYTALQFATTCGLDSSGLFYAFLHGQQALFPSYYLGSAPLLSIVYTCWTWTSFCVYWITPFIVHHLPLVLPALYPTFPSYNYG